MTDYNSLYQQSLYLSPNQQDLLLAALSSNNPPSRQQNGTPKVNQKGDPESTPGQGSSGSFSVSPTGGFDGSTFGYEDSPFLDFNPDNIDFDLDDENLIGDLPGSLPGSEDYEPGGKRKDMDDNESEESGKKRRESDDKTAKKPGRKPLTSEPTSKRKAQNRAAQRAFRERKERHLKDLETKVDELQKASDDANQENGLLRAQMERLQVELKEYRKRLSWLTTGNGVSAISAIPGAYSKGVQGLNNNEFLFDFPKFGDLPGLHIFNNGQSTKSNHNRPKETPSPVSRNDSHVPGVLSRDALNGPRANGVPPVKQGSLSSSSMSQVITPANSTSGRSTESSMTTPKDTPAYNTKPATHDTPNSDSPSSFSDSHQSQMFSSSGTSPEPGLHSPATKISEGSNHHTCNHSTIDGEESFCAQLSMACGNINNPIPAVKHNSEIPSNTPGQPADSEPVTGLDFFAQQNGGQFDPVLFGDWREPQDAILSQDFGTFFDDAFPLPDLGTPSHNLTEVANQSAAPKKDLIAQIDSKLDEDEVYPGEDKTQMLSCTKIWDRLQSMERFRNGEIDVDNLCSELRTKARCSEGGVVVNQRDVDDIMKRVK